jgi:hypothetical protein
MALQATSGLLDNSLMLAMMSPDLTKDPRESWLPEGSLADDETEREHEVIEDDLERRAGPQDEPQDGSGEHGRVEPTLVDQANHVFWRSVAVAAEGVGLPNAARGMHHYLDNTGSPLDIDPALVLRDAAPVERELSYHEGVLLDRALDILEEADPLQPLMMPVASALQSNNKFYIHESDSADWFFAVAGHGAKMEGRCYYEPDKAADGTGKIIFDTAFVMQDRYNWDQGKTVTIAGITIDDAVAGRLHEVGLAHEYDVQGILPIYFEMDYFGQHVTPNIPDQEPAPTREGTRADPSRERA